MGFDCDILFSLAGDVRRNSRALRQIRALLAEGFSVEVACFDDGGSPEALPGVRHRFIPIPRPRGPRFFARLHRAMLATAELVSARAYHASDLFTLPAMSRAATARGAALVYDARELYSGLAANHRRPWASAFWSTVERRHIRRAGLVLTVNEAIAERLASRYGISKPLVLPNVSATRRATPSGRLRSRASLPEGIPLVLYQGYLKPGRGCAPLLAAARRVDECAVVFLGEGALKKELQRSVADYGLEARVRFVDMAQPDELLAVTADADVGVCLIEPLTESLRLSLPNKLFEYLAAGVPVLASPLPEIERVVRGYDVGLTADPGDPVAVAEALQMMLSDGGARKRWSANCSRVMDDFDAQTIAGRFVDAYKNLLGAGERP